MRNADLMKINLLEYKFTKKKVVMRLARAITAYCLIILLILLCNYAIYSKALNEKTQAESVYQQLSEEHQHLVSKTMKDKNSKYVIRQELIHQLSNEQIRVVPQLNYLYTAAGTEMDIINIKISKEDVFIAANAETSEKVKDYLEKIDNCAHFGRLKEFRCENIKENTEIKFIIKVCRRT